MSGVSRGSRKRSRTEENEDDLPPAKRESDPPTPAPAGGQADEQVDYSGPVFKRDEEFWFSDGTVIFVARDIEFRVYKGVLAELSAVFKALFADRGRTVRKVSIDEEQTISCPVIHISDSPADLRHLLRACFSRRLESLYEEQDPSYFEISAAIRLGDKYKIEDWYSQSLKYLKRYFPSTLDDWLAHDHYTPPTWGVADTLGAVNLARKTGELSMLPSAFIACICVETDNPLNVAAGIGHGIALEDPDGSREYLSPDDLTVCLNGKTTLRTATITAVFRTFKPVVSPRCNNASVCKKALRDALVDLGDDVAHLLTGNPFADYESYVGGRLNVCSSCKTMVEERSLKERKEVWKRLPDLLGIEVPGWGSEIPAEGAVA